MNFGLYDVNIAEMQCYIIQRNRVTSIYANIGNHGYKHIIPNKYFGTQLMFLYEYDSLVHCQIANVQRDLLTERMFYIYDERDLIIIRWLNSVIMFIGALHDI